MVGNVSLIGMVAGEAVGSAPTALQSAFSNLVGDLQGSAGGLGTAHASSATATPSVSLQALLSNLQQDLGYGTSSSTAAVGNTLSVQC